MNNDHNSEKTSTESEMNEASKESSMLQCIICLTEKETVEFKDMAKYGCVCKTAHFCKSCIFDWLESNATDKRADLSNWSCPCCRNAPSSLKTQRINNEMHHGLWEQNEERLMELHREWCVLFDSPPFPTTPAFDWITTSEFGLYKHDSHVRVYQYQDAYYATIIFIHQPNWFMKKKLDIAMPNVPDDSDVRRQCYAHLHKVLMFAHHSCSMIQFHMLFSEFNFVRDGAEFLAEADKILANPKHDKNSNDMVIILFHEYVQSRNFRHALRQRPQYSFEEYYLIMSQ